MLNLAEFLGLAPESIHRLPAVVYFHENQLTYPVRFENERDYQFAVTNMTTALAAEQVWFNSAFHRDSFLQALGKFLKRMPDYQPDDVAKRIKNKSAVYPPGIDEMPKRPTERRSGPIRILWAARAEHDKKPEDLFEALKIIKSEGIDFRISVVGERFREIPEVFDWARSYFSEHIDRWGYQEKRVGYEQALVEADLMVSTAGHEFFGISVVEAIATGAYPVLPRRLAYPEVLNLDENPRAKEFFYDGSVKALADRLAKLAGQVESDSLWGEDATRATKLVKRFEWSNLASLLDSAAEKVIL